MLKLTKPRVVFATHILIAIAALVMLGVAFSQPLASVSLGNNIVQVVDDIYMTQECGSISTQGLPNQRKCADVDSVFKPHMQAVMGVVIALMVCIFLQFISMNFGEIVSNAFGVLVLGLAIAVIVLVAILTGFTRGGYSYKLTGTSIGVLIFVGMLVLFELFYNKLVHRVVLAPYRLVAGKKV
mgnify:CR=1 FL=1